MLFISFYTYCFRLKVDLGKVQAVSKTETQGYGYDQWVKTLHLNYSIDGHVWRTYSEQGVAKVVLHVANTKWIGFVTRDKHEVSEVANTK